MKTVELFELHQEGIVEKLEVGRLLAEGYEEIVEDNVDEIAEKGLLEDETLKVIREKFEVNQKEQLLNKAEQYLKDRQKEPTETLTNDNGDFVGYRYSVNKKVGSVKYTDVHLRISERKDTLYYGSLWYENRNGDIRKFNYEVGNDGNINYSKRIGSRYYRQVRKLTARVINWFEENLKENGVPETEEPDITDEDVEKAIEQVTQSE